MGKGWGFTLDSSDQIGCFFNKPAIGFSLTSRLNHNKDIEFPGNEFQMNHNRREDQSASSPDDENRLAVNEVNFFSDKKRSDYIDCLTSDIVVKKENSHGETTPRTGLDVNTGLHLLTANTGSMDDRISSEADNKRVNNELALLQVELEQMNAENQRLRGMVTQVSNNYTALQMHLLTVMQQQQSSRVEETTQDHEIVERKSEEKKIEVGAVTLPRQFMDLGPSATSEIEELSHSSSEERTLSGSKNNNLKDGKRSGREESLELESCVPKKMPKLDSSNTGDQATDATMRKARVSVRARSEAPMISDGCQWRKYGQKMAKGNPCPRAYYRCTMAVGCPVRKQVQRCAEDRTILITTYEGTHNHPLPPAAIAMASTTAAAASMLLSGSMSSADGLMNPNFLARAILPCSSSMATISASAPFPTVTLDLTHTTTNPLQFQRPPTQFQLPFPGHPQNFASVPTPAMPQVFGPYINQSRFSGLQVSQDMESTQLHQQAPSPQLQQAQQHHSFADTLSAATAAITADPNFTAALAAAITSIIGGAHPNNCDNSNITTTTTATDNVNTTTSNSNKTSSFPGN